MPRVTEVTFAFVDSAPERLEPGKIYVSTKYRAIVHLCLCGCNEKVLLRLDPEDWSVTFDGRTISIHDSVGNVGLPCRSHYFVRRNRVDWLPPLLDVDPQAALGQRSARDQQSEGPTTSGPVRWFRRRHRSRRN
jgi:hypothetical protein